MQINESLSPEIYSQLMTGQTINKTIYENGALTDNPLFTEIFTNDKDYNQLYRAMGFTLRLEPGFYILSDRSREPYMDVAMKVCALLEILARQMALIPLHPDALLDSNAGLPREAISAMHNSDEVQELLKTCSMKQQLVKEAENVLVGRKIAFWNNSDALVLSESGAHMYSVLFGS